MPYNLQLHYTYIITLLAKLKQHSTKKNTEKLNSFIIQVFESHPNIISFQQFSPTSVRTRIESVKLEKISSNKSRFYEGHHNFFSDCAAHFIRSSQLELNPIIRESNLRTKVGFFQHEFSSIKKNCIVPELIDKFKRCLIAGWEKIENTMKQCRRYYSFQESRKKSNVE